MKSRLPIAVLLCSVLSAAAAAPAPAYLLPKAPNPDADEAQSALEIDTVELEELIRAHRLASAGTGMYGLRPMLEVVCCGLRHHQPAPAEPNLTPPPPAGPPPDPTS